MGIQFGGNAQKPEAIEPAVTLDKKEEVVPYDMEADRREIATTLKGTQEIDDIVSKISVYDLETIVSFGSDVAENISRASDVVLNNMDMSKLDESSEMLNALKKIMDQFDIDELGEKKQNMFEKMFGGARKQLDKILSKYHTMGEQVDKIYVQLRQYESEIKQSNRQLEEMFQTNVGYFHELEKYILAGDQGVQEIDAYLAQRQKEFETSGDSSIQFDITSLTQAKMMLEQRVQDLRIAENVAMQSVPMIKTMEFTNMNLVRKINSAFIITLPVFKQALSQAMLLKRQKIQSDAMAALDEKTNEMLIKNAQNTVEQSKITTQMASGSSIKIETLETTWKTICNGIDETKAIQENARRQREQDKVRLDQIRAEFEAKCSASAQKH